MNDASVEALLDAWSTFIVGRWRPSRCGSAEKNYRPERVLDDEQRRPVVRPFSEPELWQCERAVSMLPPAYSALVRLVWCGRLHPCVAMRRAQLQPRHIGAWAQHRDESFRLLRQRLAG